MEKIKRGRPVVLNDIFKEKILWYKDSNPGLTVKEILEAIRGDLFKAYKKNHPDWNDIRIKAELEKLKWPGEDIVYKFLRSKDTDSAVSPLESNWNIGLMEKYHISTEALPFIFLAQSWAETFPDEFSQPHPPLTIRQAVWISRLYGVISAPSNVKGKEREKLMRSIGRYLYLWANAYATRDRITGGKFDSTLLDKGLRQAGEPMTVEKSTVIFYRRDNSFEIDTLDNELLKQMEAMKKDGE